MSIYKRMNYPMPDPYIPTGTTEYDDAQMPRVRNTNVIVLAVVLAFAAVALAVGVVRVVKQLNEPHYKIQKIRP